MVATVGSRESERQGLSVAITMLGDRKWRDAGYGVVCGTEVSQVRYEIRHWDIISNLRDFGAGISSSKNEGLNKWAGRRTSKYQVSKFWCTSVSCECTRWTEIGRTGTARPWDETQGVREAPGQIFGGLTFVWATFDGEKATARGRKMGKRC